MCMYVRCRLLDRWRWSIGTYGSTTTIRFNWVCCIGPRGIEWRHASRDGDWRAMHARSVYNAIKELCPTTDGRTVGSEATLEWCLIDVEIKETIVEAYGIFSYFDQTLQPHTVFQSPDPCYMFQQISPRENKIVNLSLVTGPHCSWEIA